MDAFFDFEMIRKDTNASGVLNVFVHGFLAVSSDKDKEELYSVIDGYPAEGACCLAVWDSGEVGKVIQKIIEPFFFPFRNNAPFGLLKSAFNVVSYFNDYKNLSDRASERFLVELLELVNNNGFKQVNLIGHSLGGRVVAGALIGSESSIVQVKDVVLLAAAKEISKQQVDKIVSKITGSLHNVFSSSDYILIAKPSLERCAGRREIEHELVRNYRLDFLGHTDYWSNLSSIYKSIYSRGVVICNYVLTKEMSEDRQLYDVLANCSKEYIGALSRVISTKFTSDSRLKSRSLDCVLVGEELKRMGGNTVANFFRGKGVMYFEIVSDAANYLGLKSSDRCSSTEEDEMSIFNKVFDMLAIFAKKDNLEIETSQYGLFKEYFSYFRYKETVSRLEEHFCGITFNFPREAYSVTVPSIAVIHLARKSLGHK